MKIPSILPVFAAGALAVYPAATVPESWVIGAGCVAVLLALGGAALGWYSLSVWTAVTAFLEYALSLALSNRHPGVIEPVLIWLGVLVYLDVSYLGLLCSRSSASSDARRRLSTARNGGDSQGGGGLRLSDMFGWRYAAFILVVGAAAIATASGLWGITHSERLPSGLAFPLMAVGGTLAGFAVYWTGAAPLASVAAEPKNAQDGPFGGGDR